MKAVGSSVSFNGALLSVGDHLAEPAPPGGHAHDLAVLLPDEVRLGSSVPALEDADGLTDEPVRKLELERHSTAEIVGCDEILALRGAHARRIPNARSQTTTGDRRRPQAGRASLDRRRGRPTRAGPTRHRTGRPPRTGAGRARRLGTPRP